MGGQIELELREKVCAQVRKRFVVILNYLPVALLAWTS